MELINKMSGMGCSLWLWHSLDFSLTFFYDKAWRYTKFAITFARTTVFNAVFHVLFSVDPDLMPHSMIWVYTVCSGMSVPILRVNMVCVYLAYPGPSCSKLTMSLVNVLLKLWSSNMAYMLIFFAEENVSSFCICKSYSHFFSKNTCELDIVLTRTVNRPLTISLSEQRFEQLGPELWLTGIPVI